MNNPVHTRIDDELLELLKGYCKKHKWRPSQAIREILAQFFNYELSANDG